MTVVTYWISTSCSFSRYAGELFSDSEPETWQRSPVIWHPVIERRHRLRRLRSSGSAVLRSEPQGRPDDELNGKDWLTITFHPFFAFSNVFDRKPVTYNDLLAEFLFKSKIGILRPRLHATFIGKSKGLLLRSLWFLKRIEGTLEGHQSLVLNGTEIISQQFLQARIKKF